MLVMVTMNATDVIDPAIGPEIVQMIVITVTEGPAAATITDHLLQGDDDVLDHVLGTDVVGAHDPALVAVTGGVAAGNADAEVLAAVRDVEVVTNTVLRIINVTTKVHRGPKAIRRQSLPAVHGVALPASLEAGLVVCQK